MMFKCATVKCRGFHELQTFNCDEETNEKRNAFYVSSWDHQTIKSKLSKAL